MNHKENLNSQHVYIVGVFLHLAKKEDIWSIKTFLLHQLFSKTKLISLKFVKLMENVFLILTLKGNSK